MKDQYFGDINDYHKYALLRSLLLGGQLKLLVAWMLTKGDESSDGKKRRYLQQPDKWKHLDDVLFDRLFEILKEPSVPLVSLIETAGLLPNSKFYNRKLKDRASWLNGLIEDGAESDLVFLDPDNGIEISSKRVISGREGTEKYLSWDEIKTIWDTGKSLLIYQHGRREPHEKTGRDQISELSSITHSPLVMGFWTGSVFFFLVAQERHCAKFQTGLSLFLNKWDGDIFEKREVALKSPEGLWKDKIKVLA